MTADDVRGEDYEAAKTVPARTRVTGDPWKRSVRGHDPLCPIARETWCVWTGDLCERCALIRKVRAEALDQARAAVVDADCCHDSAASLAAIDELRADHA